MVGADHVVFFSEHTLADAVADDLIDPGAASVVPIGVDHRVLTTSDGVGQRPGGLTASDAPFLLCLGADLGHKDQAFAIKLMGALRVGHG